jgi:hypothetical protein
MKKYFLIVSCVFLLYIITKKDKIYYIPFNIPGSQMAATIPPFGIFIESKYKTDKSILRHEMVHWLQYNRMGFFKFYYTYISEYKKYGRKYGPMEVEARKLSKLKHIN